MWSFSAAARRSGLLYSYDDAMAESFFAVLKNERVADADGVYHPAAVNDRLLLGLKGAMSEAAQQASRLHF